MRLKPLKQGAAAPRVFALGGAAVVTGLIVAAQLIAPAAASQDSGAGKAQAERCAAMAGKTLGGAVIQSGEYVASGATLLKTPFGDIKASVNHCRLKATTSSGPGSSIRMEVFLPQTWNGKLVGIGGGGLSGGLGVAPIVLGPVMKQGYAGVATDAGHEDSPNAAWALNAPARIKDFGYNANHLAAVAAKATVGAYYGQPATKAYFHGCSNGGRDALMLAQRFPDDYDGIVAGAPAADYTGVMAQFGNYALLFKTDPAAKTLQPKLSMVRQAVIQKCDRLDGVADGVLEDPRTCKFDPAALQCKPGEDAAKCLTKPEIDIVRKVYHGTRGRDGKLIYSGLPVSSEFMGGGMGGWGPWFLGATTSGSGLAQDFYRGLVKQDVKWDLASFNLDRDNAEAKAKVGADLDALDPNLTPFIKSGGKLLIYHGWEDSAIPAGATLDYYAAMRKRTGSPAADAVRLFMAPGMSHCGMGPGPNVLDHVGEIDRWVSSGKAPEQIIASTPDNVLASFKGEATKTLRTRPLCAFPKTAHYNGSGSTDEAANFSCKLPKGVKG